MVPQGLLQYFISQENCPNNVSVLIQFDEIQNLATLTYQLRVLSSDGCALQECPMLLSSGERVVTVTLLDRVDYTATLIVSNDCGSGTSTIQIRPGMYINFKYCLHMYIVATVLCVIPNLTGSIHIATILQLAQNHIQHSISLGR